MTYHLQQGVDTSVARIFNSILADEQVVFDDGRELRRVQVSELARELEVSRRLVAYASPGAGGSAVVGASEYELEGYSVPAFAAVRQAFAFAGAAESGQVPYVLRGKLAGGPFGTTRFIDQGTLSLPAAGGALP